MPPQALALAFAASIYPPAVAAVIALGRGSQVRSRVAAFVLGAALVTYASGALMLLVFDEVGVAGPRRRTPSAAFDLALGVSLIALAAWLRRRPSTPKKQGGPSKIERYLQNRRLAFLLGITLYVVPSPIYIGAVKALADANLSTSGGLLALAATVVVMLWLIELPMLALLIIPGRASSALERINAWFGQRGRGLAVLASAGAGVYLAVKGLVDLIG